jgi:Xaa-Pro aminopeptidase
MGFMKGDVDEAVEEGAHALFFPCGTGHMMGMDVHDMENLGEKYVGYGGREKSTKFGIKSLRLARELEPGFVLTIEPGIYFIPELIDSWRLQGKFTRFIDYDKVETYKDFGGIRNEEDLLITDDGYRVLGKPKPKTIQDVEALSRSGHRSARQELPCS